jgi:signal transduction histidine kinase
MIQVRPRVLLVDDVEANLVALRALLGDMACELVSASSGNDALKQLLKGEFAVMLLDVQMPEMDGYEVARYARDNPATRDVPIIFLTAMHETEENRLRGYGSGAVDFLFKPISAVILRSKVRVFLDLCLERGRLADRIEAHQRTLSELEAANEALRRSTEEATEARRQAEQASHFKSQFVANMSHELRTPLSAVIGFAEILQEGLQDEQKEFAGYILQSGRHLRSLIVDILDLSTIEAGRVVLRREWIALQNLVGSTGGTLRQSAEKKGVRLTFDVPIDLPPIYVDPIRINQILFNLLSNAIKFTASGGIVTLTAGVLMDCLSIAVEDTGVGISQKDMPRLFHEFERIDSGAGPMPEGTGLGLALTKRLVELHGGRIVVRSEPGKGTTFTVEISLTALVDDARSPAPIGDEAVPPADLTPFR